MNNIKVVIMAAGQGTRMKSKVPKVLHKVLDKTMIDYIIDASIDSGIEDICVVVGNKSAMVKAMLGDRVKYAVQKEQLGTGHAVMQAEEFINSCENVIVLNGDLPLIKSDTIKNLAEIHIKENNSATLITVDAENPEGYGRIVRDKNMLFDKIIEQKDVTEEENKIKEINAGAYIFNSKDVIEALKEIKTNNEQKEYYLTDVLEILKNKNKKVGIMKSPDEVEFMGVNSKLQLAQVTKQMKKRINENFMLNGVTIEDPDNTYIGADVIIEADTVILPGTIIEGKTVIGTDCLIGPNTRITNSIIKDGVTIQSSTLLSAEVDNYTIIGPFAYLRPNTKLGEHVKVGDFVEIKNSTVDDGTKINHLTYVGDADVGKNVNFGCGTVTVNYDGKNKYRTTIGDNVFIGCNTNLVAPVILEDNSFTAAGSTITHDVPKDSLSIARSKQVNKVGWRKYIDK